VAYSSFKKEGKLGAAARPGGNDEFSGETITTKQGCLPKVKEVTADKIEEGDPLEIGQKQDK